MLRKYIITTLLSVLAVSFANAQTYVTSGLMKGKDFGVTYYLPKTIIKVHLDIKKTTYEPGMFANYAERFLDIRGVKEEAYTKWQLRGIRLEQTAIPDIESVYFVKMNEKTKAVLMELTDNGIIKSINMPFVRKENPKKQVKEEKDIPEEELDPRNLFTQEINAATSVAKMAELTAQEIYAIKDSRNSLLRGENDNMPTDGAQLKLMIDRLDKQEKALMSLFVGKTIETNETINVDFSPTECEDKILARFSKKLGVLDVDNLAGKPIYITVENLSPRLEVNENGKQQQDGVVYNLPGRARVVVNYEGQTMVTENMQLPEFGTQEYLAPVLFNKKATTKVLFNPLTGGIIKIDR